MSYIIKFFYVFKYLETAASTAKSTESGVWRLGD